MVNQISLGAAAPIITAGGSPAPVAARSASGPSVTGSPRAVASEAAVAQVNQHLQQTDLKLQVDAGSGRTVFQVVQQGTGQVVMQVPSEEVLGMSRRMRDLDLSGSSGALVDQQG